MKMSKKTASTTIWVCIIVMMAVLFYLDWTKVIDNGWIFPLFFIGTPAIVGAVMFIQSRVDPEAYKAWKAELLKEAEEDEKAEKEIKGLQIRRTLGGTICEFITLVMLIVSWIMIFHKQMFADGSMFRLNILLTVGAIWFLVTAYSHKVMGFKPTTTRQLQLGIYRKRALAIGCAIFLMIGAVFPNTELSKAAEVLLIVFAVLLIVIFTSKFFINLIKKQR
jgi:hypothetical protein